MSLRLATVCLAAALSCAAAPTHAQGLRKMSDAELSEVSGQALLNLTNTSLEGLDFTRITLGADIQLSANLSKVRLGEYSYTARNGTGADIDIGLLQFGRSDGTEAQRTVNISDPYFEFVYKNTGNAATREVVGMRLGFGSIQGDLGVQLNAISGSLLINAGAAGTLDSHNDPLGGKRWDGTACNAGATCGVSLSQLGMLTAGDANGPSRDFFISVLKQQVQFPSTNGGLTLPDRAMDGFWLNWRDRVYAPSLNLPPPPNLPKPPGG
jgi:opacity protein-like surface antigen